MKALLKTLSEAYGPSGAEGPVRELVRAEIRQLADYVTVDPLGNLIMRFPENADPKGVIRDMKLLLKASQIG